LADYQSLFRRLWVEINGESPNKYAKAYQWARFNLLQASRGNHAAPRNEQGIWNQDLVPHYRSNYTLNENPEKYYVLAEAGNIPEAVQPLINFVGNLAKQGVVTAQNMYQARGWVTHHNSDVFAMTTPATGRACWALWPMGGIWLTQHVWERYAFGMDQAYLRDTAYPIMKGAAQFALDLLVTNKNGYLVTSPSTSPENSFLDSAGNTVAVSAGTTADMGLIRELFQHTAQASQLLGVDADLRQEIATAQAKLIPFQVGSKKQLQEWSEDFTESEPTHRHASHLFAVWPLAQITRTTPDLLAAAKISLDLRGAGGYHPDKAGMYARLLDGDKALAAFGTSYPTLYDTPSGGFAEMLMQSQTGDIDLLPALPTSFTSGKALGLRARGGYEVDVVWSGGQLTNAVIRNAGTTTPTIRVKGVVVPTTDPRIVIQP